MSLFTPRAAFKPFRYQSVVPYKLAIQESFWTIREFSFTSDTQDFHTRLDDAERSAITRALLAISQVEVSVKRFWADLGKRLPHPEVEQVGVCFGESEVRHADAYSHLLEVLGLNDAFGGLLDVPAIRGRVDYLREAMSGAKGDDRDFARTLALFGLFVENCSLFSQFLVIKSFNKQRNVLKDVDNVVQATIKEEGVHALFAAHLVGLIREENPGWFGAGFAAAVRAMAHSAFEAERAIVGWIFERGDLPSLPRSVVIEFLKDRFNRSLALIGLNPIFDPDPAAMKSLAWFDEEVLADTQPDFFNKRPVSYSRGLQAITPDELF